MVCLKHFQSYWDLIVDLQFLCSDVITHFSFVLTNITSKWTFGYCRHTPNSDTCLAILSDLPWHCTFYRILDHCAELMNRPVWSNAWATKLGSIILNFFLLLVFGVFGQLYASTLSQWCSVAGPRNVGHVYDGRPQIARISSTMSRSSQVAESSRWCKFVDIFAKRIVLQQCLFSYQTAKPFGIL